MRRGRSFLLPVGVALAALAPKGAVAHPDGAQLTSDGANARNLSRRLTQPLLALSRTLQSAASVLGHSSHSSHVSHASHASHFSSSGGGSSGSGGAGSSATVAPSTSTGVTHFGAHLTAAQEVPSPVGAPIGASGQFTASLNGNVLTWRLTLGRLSSGATAAVIHMGVAGAVGPRLVGICGPCSSPASGKTTLTQAQLVDLLAGLAYINIGTSQNPAGEIRGQIRLTTTASASNGSVGVGGGGGGHASHVSHASHASHSSHFSSG